VTKHIENIPINIIRSSRKTISIEIKTDYILIRAPKYMSRRSIYAFLNEKRSWIEKHLYLMQERKVALGLVYFSSILIPRELKMGEDLVFT